jgi:hypothetical protein
MKIEKFDKKTCAFVAEKAAEALKTLAHAHGLEFKYRGGTFSHSSFQLRGEFATSSLLKQFK